MKRKSVFIFGITGVLALSIGFMKDLDSTEVLVNEQPISESVFIGQADIDDGDQYKAVTKEEQEMRENNLIDERDYSTVITAKEQKMVENSTALSGFVPQENGPGFFFKKENKAVYNY
ncbi:hypothetical protein ACFSTA_07390 [Ornithinibacillus salinisoli]|uniref:Uncharacterized protein n=1 Tax=Ornithinibacillus salinisoli TaxID=1848459 RepID=A0ABW4VZT7_9BACI